MEYVGIKYIQYHCEFKFFIAILALADSFIK